MKNKELRDRIIDVVSDSTLHGFPRVFKSKSWLAKLMWTICFLGSLGYCSYLIFQSICNFLVFDTVMNTKVVNENLASFPVITICNLNQFQNNNSFDIFKKYIGYPMLKNQKNFFIINELFSLNETFQRSVSFSLNETLISCRFNNIPCSASDFVWIFVPFYGKINFYLIFIKFLLNFEFYEL